MGSKLHLSPRLQEEAGLEESQDGAEEDSRIYVTLHPAYQGGDGYHGDGLHQGAGLLQPHNDPKIPGRLPVCLFDWRSV